LEAAPDVPALLMSGTEDGVFAASAAKYGADGADPVAATFDRGLPGGRHDSWLVQLKGANHFPIGTHEDPTAARGFLDGVASVPPEQTRETLITVLAAFLHASLSGEPDARAQLEQLETDPPPTIAVIRRR